MAVQELVNASLLKEDEIIGRLLANEMSEDPEVSSRVKGTLMKIFLRLEKGFGAPQTGLVVKSKLTTYRNKLGTRPLVDVVKEGTAAMESGLQKGDLILSVNGLFLDQEDAVGQLNELLQRQESGAHLKICYARKIADERKEFETILILGDGKSVPQNKNEFQQEFNSWKSKRTKRKR